MLQKINTYQGREVGVHTGELREYLIPAWLCTKCDSIFYDKERAEHHINKHRDSNDAKTQERTYRANNRTPTDEC